MRRWVIVLCVCLPAWAEKEKLSEEERLALIRGLTAETAKAKVLIPRSKKPLTVSAKSVWDQAAWDAATKESGPAARLGELITVTKVDIKDDRIELELNYGLKSGRTWKDRVQVGVGGNTQPISRNDARATAGSYIAVVFDKRLTTLEVADVKRILAPVLDFDKRTVTENYMENIPAPIKKAIADQRVIDGMDKDQVMAAVGRPLRKERRTVDGNDLEDWMYGRAPGKLTFVTFEGNKVAKVKEMYAGLGGSTAADLPVQ